ncbi:MAG TPA: DUF4280 domain-containing protein [Acidimicrobiales bacterium]|nr:DUF4280 domain-containing protein [Acidimicrobiales bacterium]
MPVQVVEGALMMCSFGVAPAALNCSVPPTRVMASDLPTANIGHSAPMINIPTFGMCSSIANPEVASATAAALGVLTPMPCIPATGTPWVPGSPDVMIGELPALTNDCTCMCMWGGEITISEPGQFQVETT